MFPIVRLSPVEVMGHIGFLGRIVFLGGIVIQGRIVLQCRIVRQGRVVCQGRVVRQGRVVFMSLLVLEIHFVLVSLVLVSLGLLAVLRSRRGGPGRNCGDVDRRGARDLGKSRSGTDDLGRGVDTLIGSCN